MTESLNNNTPVSRADWWIAMILCATIIAIWTLEQLLQDQSAGGGAFAPDWLPCAAAVIAAAGIIRWNEEIQWLRTRKAIQYIGLFLLVWTANGLPFDLLRLTPLMPPGVDWPSLVIRTLAMAAAVMILRFTLGTPNRNESTRVAAWYGYAAFLFALPYPVLRTFWALGGTAGLLKPGAAGEGFIPWLACIPWLMAAVLSLLLISTRPRIPRRLLLASGWFATGTVALIGPAACWSLVTKLVTGADIGSEVGIAAWVPCLFYGSWLLWALAAGAATRSYQLRSAVSAPGTVEMNGQ